MGVDFQARKAAKKNRKREESGQKRVRKKKNQPRRLCRGPCYAVPQLELEDLEGVPAKQRLQIVRTSGLFPHEKEASKKKRESGISRKKEKDQDEGKCGTPLGEEDGTTTSIRSSKKRTRTENEDGITGENAKPSKNANKAAKLSTIVNLLDPEKLKSPGEPSGNGILNRAGEIVEDGRLEGLPDIFLKYMKGENLKSPTTVQSLCWPEILAGENTQVVAPPGAGKTLGYVLPIFSMLLDEDKSKDSKAWKPRALVLVPTRELAQQASRVIKKVRRYCPHIKVSCITGGDKKDEQVKELEKMHSQIVVATPGRLLDLYDSEKIDLAKIRIVVIDESDKMLQKGLLPQIDRLRKIISEDSELKGRRKANSEGQIENFPLPQVAFFTATMPSEIIDLAKNWLENPKYIELTASDDFINSSSDKNNLEKCEKGKDGHSQAQISKTIVQIVQVCADHKKPAKLMKHLSKIKESALEAKLRHQPRVLIFVNRIKTCRSLDRLIAAAGYRVTSLHGDKLQSERTQALLDFKSGKCNILVATDVASRGLDIAQLPYIVNYDFPFNLETYVHRVGRTGRLAADGHAYSFMTRDMAPMAGAVIDLLEVHGQNIDPNLIKLSEAYKVASSKLERLPKPKKSNDDDILSKSKKADKVGGTQSEDLVQRLKPTRNEVLAELGMKKKRVKNISQQENGIEETQENETVDKECQSSKKAFIPSKQFIGAKPGYIFTKRSTGQGYYLDLPLHIAMKQAGKRSVSSINGNLQKTSDAVSSKANKRGRIGKNKADLRPIGGTGLNSTKKSVPLLPGKLKKLQRKNMD